MSFFGVGNPFSTPVGQKIEQATDGSLPSENWALNMEICDIVNSSADGPKDAIKAIRKRLTQSAGKNYTIVMHTLTVLETCVKNCGKSFHVQACNKEFISELVKLIGPKNDPPTVVQEKVLSLIQCWADAFQNQPDLQGVVQVYTELRTKGVEFPMTDLDAMAPIFTPQRSVPDSGEPMIGSPQRSAMPQTSPSRPTQEQILGTVTLSESQTNKLRADLAVVEGNMNVMNDMLNELTTQPHAAHHDSDIELLNVRIVTAYIQSSTIYYVMLMNVMNDMLNELTTQPHAAHHDSDIELLNELTDTLRAMQTRVAELIGRLAGESPLTGELLHANDRLNNLLLRHGRFINNRNAATGGATPSAILGAAMGVPGSNAPTSPKKPDDDALIDLSDDVPDIAKLSVRDSQPDKSPGSSKDEFDMFAQSRNLTYENSKTGGSSYADNLEEQSSVGLASIASQRATQGQPLPSGMDEREIDEIAAWLAQEKAASEAAGGQESVTSSDFDKFLAERAAAADSLPAASAAPAGGPPAANPPPAMPAALTPRHRQINKDDHDSMFAL
ncbi:target of Myb protein 1 isoform X1 [Spodoptera frugiperda]|uniref:Target of Myb protein 1 isoform X1 n=1 Tax=Spodoptera frugiperda TaxID=7108 RepID=A0A9R0DM44_SPOFR|nr:target of Myb protein 1 isoform X1 [Spodoptera frugiperda]